ncbi:MAG TPA: hypothetical protein VEZ70_04075 [Allosphingosinicella sp.]|nr:hypothetical protein [Allosphingosinicella sp.]
MKTIIQSQTSKTLQTSLPFASPVIALAAMLLIAAGSGVAAMMG